MTQFWRAQVELDNDSGAVEDKVVNTWHIRSDEVDTDTNDIADIMANLSLFYVSVDAHMSPNLSGAWRVKFYRLLDAEPRVPVGTIEGAGLTLGAAPLPNEVAVCLSYRAAMVSGINRQRRRGRLFIGPLASSATELVDGTGDARVAAALRADLVAAAEAFRTGLGGITLSTLEWCVASRADYEDAAPPGVTNSTVGWTAAFHTVVGGRVDNAFDIQRRRGRISDGDSVFGAGWA